MGQEEANPGKLGTFLAQVGADRGCHMPCPNGGAYHDDIIVLWSVCRRFDEGQLTSPAIVSSSDET
jgi:hypothetical protein